MTVLMKHRFYRDTANVPQDSVETWQAKGWTVVEQPKKTTTKKETE